MKIRCACDDVIVDQTDFISNKARLIADQDWEDFLETAEEGNADWSLSRAVYQCRSCGRLYLEDQNGDLRAFVPEERSGEILSSVKKDDWKRPLIGSWDDSRKSSGPKGYLWCEGEQEHSFDEWAALEKKYLEVFEKLQAQYRLRSALLRKNGQDIHTW